jgi:DNA-binding Xre family transcriptional regulator
MRVARGVTRHELARRAGISYATLSRLEYEKVPNAPLWWYRNLAIALEVELDEILDEQDRRWRRTDMASKPPPPGWFNPSRAPRSRRSPLAEGD